MGKSGRACVESTMASIRSIWYIATYGVSAYALMALADWRLGLSAVIEEKDGGTSWWALAHPPGKPDFHHDDCFAARLAAIGPA